MNTDVCFSCKCISPPARMCKLMVLLCTCHCMHLHVTSLLLMLRTQLCKYGVVPTEAFIADLRGWKHFYFAGRMQKPVGLARPRLGACP